MADTNFNSANHANCFKEAVCINAGRVYDSCSDKDCLEDLQVLFTNQTQPIIDNALSVKCRRVEVLNVFLDVEPIPFNKGFYSVDMTFFFKVHIDAYTSPLECPTPVCGVAIFSKKVILYGSEGGVKVFTSEGTCCHKKDRSVQMMVPVYDFCIPDKECVTTTDDPCELFQRIKFPVNEFFPPRLNDLDCEDPTASDFEC